MSPVGVRFQLDSRARAPRPTPPCGPNELAWLPPRSHRPRGPGEARKHHVSILFCVWTTMWKLKLTYFYVKFFYSLIFNKLWKPGGGRVRAPSSGWGGRPPAWPSRFLAKAVKGGFVHRPGDFGTELRFRAEPERVGVGARSASTGPQWNFQVTRLVWDSWPDPATPQPRTLRPPREACFSSGFSSASLLGQHSRSLELRFQVPGDHVA